MVQFISDFGNIVSFAKSVSISMSSLNLIFPFVNSLYLYVQRQEILARKLHYDVKNLKKIVSCFTQSSQDSKSQDNHY